MSHRRRLSLILVLCLAAVALVWQLDASRRRARNVAGVFEAIAGGHLEQAERAAEECLQVQYDGPLIQAMATALANAGEDPRALVWFDRFQPDFEIPEHREAWLQKADVLLRLGHLTKSQACLQQIAEADPAEHRAISRLAQNFAGVGLGLQSVMWLRQEPESSAWQLSDLLLLARNGNLMFTRQRLERLAELQPDDQLVVCGLLELAWKSRDVADVKRILQTAEPSLEIAHHIERAQSMMPEEEFAHWDGPLYVIGYPFPHNRLELLLVASTVHGVNWNNAVRLRRLLDQVPWSIEAGASLANRLRGDYPQRARRLADLVEQLRRMELLATSAAAEIEQSAAGVATAELVEQLCELHRFDEARGWARLAVPERSDLLTMVERYAATAPPFDHPGLFEFKLPDSEQSNGDDVSPAAPLLFADQTAAAGLEFQYENGVTPDQEGVRMHQWTGGGIAVVDFNNDAWPDVWLTQGGQRGRPRSDLVDVLVRNQQGHSLQDVTASAGLQETGFGQGVAAGDVNHDGFTDLYIANVGHNRLLLNQGDGTFVTQTLKGDAWTTSVAIADLTGDGVPDLYDVNYVQGDNVYTQTCNHDGRQRVCAPTDFDASADVLHVGDGGGGFRRVVVDQTRDSGRGMGLLVGDLLNDGQVGVYVANDESPNQLLHFGADGRVQSEVAMRVGAAVSADGQPQGSMGIAAGDFDRNGRPDLFVTNYYSEANNLYRMVTDGLFADEASSPLLTRSGFGMLGFGCQFFDANSNGWCDLAVANGHLDDFTFQGKPYRMPTQLYANHQGTLRPSTTSADLAVPRLGRALVTLDWNRDGRVDLLLGDLETSVTLLENRTPQERPTVSLTLIGRTVAREPVGARVGLPGAAFPQAWLTAGDGYQCSNQRLLRMAVLPAGPVQHITVDWGNRNSETVAAEVDLAHSSARYAIIEGRNQVYRIPR